MAEDRWNIETFQRIRAYLEAGKTWTDIGILEGVARSTVCEAYEKMKQQFEEVGPQNPGRKFKENKETGEASVEIKTWKPVKTEKDAIRVAEVDLSVWYVHSWECRQWTTPLNIKQGQKVVKVKKVFHNGIKGHNLEERQEEELKWRPSKPIQQQQYLVALKLRRKSPEILSVEALLNEIKESKRVLLPVFDKPKIKGNHKPRRALEISVMDPHLGLRCYQPQADMAWSLEDAEKYFMSTTERLLDHSLNYGPFEEIVCAIGNDYFHADNYFHTTTKGCPQPEMEDLHKVYVHGQKLMLWFTEKLRSVCGKVKLYSIPGNHDEHSSFTLARVIQAYYAGAKAEDVEIDASASPYKFWSYGVNLIGFEHGHAIDTVRMAALMANETRLTHWMGARYCEWHLGDQHRKGSAKPVTMEEQGVSVEYLPGLTPPNAWHRKKSYNWQKRGAMAFVYDYEAGPIARLQVNFDSYTGKHLGV